METSTKPSKELRLLIILLAIVFSSQLSFSQTLTKESNKSKLKYGLQTLLKNYQYPAGVPNSDSLITLDNSVYTLTQDSIMVDAIAENEASVLINDLKAQNITIVAHYGKTVTCWIGFEQLAALEKVESCRWIQPTFKPIKNSGTVQSQGDSAQRSDIARTITGLNGAGVKVGVLSDSYNNKNGANAGIAAGELPGVGNPNGLTTPVTIIKDMPGTSGSDEGRAMLEIVHDVAPNSDLYFYTAFVSKSDFAAGITSLANQGCKVIIDDVVYFNEAFFQDDIVAQAVNTVKAADVTYFSSAINSKNYSYENGFQVGPPINENWGSTHNFGTASQPVTKLPITIPGYSGVTIVFQWNQPFFSISGGTGTTTDMDLYLLNSANGIIAKSESNNIGGDAFEAISVSNSSSGTAIAYIAITKFAGVDPSKMKLVFFRNSSSLFSNAPPVTGLYGPTSFGHANAAGAISVGAANFNNTPAFGVNPPLIASYSSYGGIPILFDQNGAAIGPIIRNKPEIVAPDGANTSFFASDSNNDSDSYPNFFGTSAAAPHAGAVAALMKQAKPTATPDEIKTALINSCTDMGTPGFDFISGNGLIKADNAILSLYSVTANTPGITSLCQGQIISVSFSSVGIFKSSNIYKLELSNSSGSFSAPTTLGTTINASNSGTITGIIPLGATPGSGYKLRFVTSEPSKSSNEIAISINAIPSAPSPNSNSRCGTGTVPLTASGCAGGTIKWFANATATTVLATGGTYTTPSISSTTTYYINCTLNNCVSSKNTITATVNTQPAAPAAFSASRCGTGTVPLTASGCAGGTIKWFANATATTVLATGGTYTTPSISSTTTYYVNCTLGTCISSKNTIIATVDTQPAAPAAFSASRCGTGTVPLTASGCAGGTIKWFANATATTVLATGGAYTTPSISSTTTYYVNCTLGTCISSKNTITATVNTQPAAPSTTSASRCGAGSVTLTATGCSGGTIKWFANATATTILATGGTYTTPNLSNTTTYYAGCVVGNCINKATVTATVNIAISFTSPTQAAGTYRASQTITSSTNVGSPTNYHAGKSITLIPGFQAGPTEVFLASVQNCP